MTSTAAERNLLHNGLSEKIGEREAAILMDHLPPTGWADVATKQDVAHLKESVDLRFDELDLRLTDRFVAIDQRFDEMDRRFTDRFGDIDRRFGDIDRRFGDIDRRFDELERQSRDRDREMHRRFSELPSIFATRKDLETLMTRVVGWLFALMTIYFSLFSALVLWSK
jgi:hypothetical protein